MKFWRRIGFAYKEQQKYHPTSLSSSSTSSSSSSSYNIRILPNHHIIINLQRTNYQIFAGFFCKLTLPFPLYYVQSKCLLDTKSLGFWLSTFLRHKKTCTNLKNKFKLAYFMMLQRSHDVHDVTKITWCYKDHMMLQRSHDVTKITWWW